MKKLTLGLLVLLLGAGATLAGCRQPDGESPGETVTAYLKAFGAGDGVEACDRLSDETRRVIAPRLAQKLGGTSCPDAIRSLRDRLSASQAAALGRATATRVEETGETAEVSFRAGSQRGVARLRETDDGWKITLVPGTP